MRLAFEFHQLPTDIEDLPLEMVWEMEEFLRMKSEAEKKAAEKAKANIDKNSKR